MTSGALVGPLQTIRFWDGTRIPYETPRDTTDLRYALCRSHRPACDCREAEFNETLSEYRNDRERTRKVASAILAGHRTHDHGSYRRQIHWLSDDLTRWTDEYTEDPDAYCSCTGCQIVREAYLL